MDLWSVSWSLAQVSTPATTVAPAATQAAEGAATTAVASTATQPATQRAPEGGLFSNPLLIMAPLLIVGYFLMTRGPKKEEKKRKAMMDGMKRGDEVETIGGLFGKIVDVKDDRVVIKIDEATNVRAAYRKGAILRVVTQDDKDKEKDKAEDAK